MKRIFLLCLIVSVLGCVNTAYRFERIDGDQFTELPLKFDGIYGVRDGASVNAEARFTDGADHVTMNISLFLRPEAQFLTGTYQAVIGGKTTSGNVECPSLMFLGGQTALPDVGGLFILRDQQNQPAFRVRIPATTLTRRVSK